MPKLLKRILFAVLGLMGITLLLFAALSYFVDSHFCKPWLERIASQTLGMELRINGPMTISFFPVIHVRLLDMQIRHRGIEIASGEEVDLKIAPIPLIYRKLQIKKIGLKGFHSSIDRKDLGAFPFEKRKAGNGPFQFLMIDDLSISDGDFRYKDEKSGETFVVENYSIDVDEFLIKRGDRTRLLERLTFTGEFACSEIRTKGVLFSDVTFTCKGKEGRILFNPVTTSLFGGQGSGRLEIDFSDPIPRYSIHATLLKFKIEEYLKKLSFDKAAEGAMDFSATLSFQGNSLKEMVRTVMGEVSLAGENLTLHGNDLDRAFVSFESSQNFNLVDTVTFFFAGPLGLVVTAGYKFLSIFKGAGKSRIQRLFSDWKIHHGKAQARDVAMSTKQNRVALKGGIDFVNERFDNVIIALINDRGCARVRQTVHGPFGKPVIEKPTVLMSVVGLTMNMLEKTRGVFTGEKCEIFYRGSISAP
jgi:AsmA protein